MCLWSTGGGPHWSALRAHHQYWIHKCCAIRGLRLRRSRTRLPLARFANGHLPLVHALLRTNRRPRGPDCQMPPVALHTWPINELPSAQFAKNQPLFGNSFAMATWPNDVLPLVGKSLPMATSRLVMPCQRLPGFHWQDLVSGSPSLGQCPPPPGTALRNDLALQNTTRSLGSALPTCRRSWAMPSQPTGVP